MSSTSRKRGRHQARAEQKISEVHSQAKEKAAALLMQTLQARFETEEEKITLVQALKEAFGTDQMDEDTGNGGLQRKGQLCFSGSKRGAGDEHNEVCEVCERGGELLCCDTCSLVFHLECVLPKMSKFPKGKWSCAFCLVEGQKGNITLARKAVSAMKRRARARLKKRKVGTNCSSGDSDEEEKNDLTNIAHSNETLSDYTITKGGRRYVLKHKVTVVGRYNTLKEALGAFREAQVGSDVDSEEPDDLWCPYCLDDTTILVCGFCGCKKCFGKHDTESLLLCDGCDREYHTYCLDPPLWQVPEGKWYCEDCKDRLENMTVQPHEGDANKFRFEASDENIRKDGSSETSDGTSPAVRLCTGEDPAIEPASDDRQAGSVTEDTALSFPLDCAGDSNGCTTDEAGDQTELLVADVVTRPTIKTENNEQASEDSIEVVRTLDDMSPTEDVPDMQQDSKPMDEDGIRCKKNALEDAEALQDGSLISDQITVKDKAVSETPAPDIRGPCLIQRVTTFGTGGAVQSADEQKRGTFNAVFPVNSKRVLHTVRVQSPLPNSEHAAKRQRLTIEEESYDISYDLNSVLLLTSHMSSRMLDPDELTQLDNVRRRAVSDHLHALLDALHQQKHLLLQKLDREEAASFARMKAANPSTAYTDSASKAVEENDVRTNSTAPALSKPASFPNAHAETGTNGMDTSSTAKDGSLARPRPVTKQSLQEGSRSSLSGVGAGVSSGTGCAAFKSLNGHNLGNLKLAKAAAILRKAESIAKANGTYGNGRLSTGALQTLNGHRSHSHAAVSRHARSSQPLSAAAVVSHALSSYLDGGAHSLSDSHGSLGFLSLTDDSTCQGPVPLVDGSLLQFISHFTSQLSAQRDENTAPNAHLHQRTSEEDKQDEARSSALHAPQNVAEALAFLGTAASSLHVPSVHGHTHGHSYPPSSGVGVGLGLGLGLGAGLGMAQLLAGDVSFPSSFHPQGQGKSDLFGTVSGLSAEQLAQLAGVGMGDMAMQPQHVHSQSAYAQLSSLGFASLLDYASIARTHAQTSQLTASQLAALSLGDLSCGSQTSAFSASAVAQTLRELHQQKSQTDSGIRPTTGSAAAAAQLAMLTAAIGGVQPQHWTVPELLAALSTQHWAHAAGESPHEEKELDRDREGTQGAEPMKT